MKDYYGFIILVILMTLISFIIPYFLYQNPNP